MNIHLSRLHSLIANLPQHYGVYLFYADNAQYPLYIGKSNNIQQRVKSHCYEAESHDRKFNLMSQVARIDYHLTAGDIGACLLEATWIKCYLPIFNRQLRRQRHVYYYQLKQKNENFTLLLSSSNAKGFNTADDCFGFFRSQRHARQALLDICQENKLCAQTLHLVGGTGPCFNYQLGQCLGVCAAKEKPTEHNQRVLKALNMLVHQIWPYEGTIALIEENSTSRECDIHYVNQWRYLGTKRLTEAENQENLSTSEGVPFDRDHYKILLSAMTKPGSSIIELNANDMEKDGIQILKKSQEILRNLSIEIS